eukprot:8522991-Alexandrium_andersonii.AAC.1
MCIRDSYRSLRRPRYVRLDDGLLRERARRLAHGRAEAGLPAPRLARSAASADSADSADSAP